MLLLKLVGEALVAALEFPVATFPPPCCLKRSGVIPKMFPSDAGGTATTSATAVDALFHRSVAPLFKKDQVSPEATFSVILDETEETNERAPLASSTTSPELPEALLGL